MSCTQPIQSNFPHRKIGHYQVLGIILECGNYLCWAVYSFDLPMRESRLHGLLLSRPSGCVQMILHAAVFVFLCLRSWHYSSAHIM